MDLRHALMFSHNTVQQDIVCESDAISGLCRTLDRLGAQTAMIICGPTILQSADVVPRVQQALAERCVGLFAGVLPHAPNQFRFMLVCKLLQHNDLHDSRA